MLFHCYQACSLPPLVVMILLFSDCSMNDVSIDYMKLLVRHFFNYIWNYPAGERMVHEYYHLFANQKFPDCLYTTSLKTKSSETEFKCSHIRIKTIGLNLFAYFLFFFSLFYLKSGKSSYSDFPPLDC